MTNKRIIMSVRLFFGRSSQPPALAARITNQTVHDSRTAPAEAQAMYSLDSSGIAHIETSTTSANIPGEWLVAGNPAGLASKALDFLH